jgi:hypothetical protein
MVFPEPALPQTRVGRPAGSPPPVISSRPATPVGHFGRFRLGGKVLVFNIVGSVVKLFDAALHRKGALLCAVSNI